MKKEYFAEWGKTVQERAFFVSVDTLKGRQGFESVYRFTRSAAETMQTRGSVAGCSNFPVYTDRLIIDLDDGIQTAQKLKTILNKKKLAYLVYNSGNKGYHFVIPCKPIFDLEVPYTQKVWVQNLNINADLSLYRHNSMVRLPGTINEKTGNRKKLVYINKGKKLVFNKFLEDPSRYKSWQGSDDIISDTFIQNIFSKGLRLIRQKPLPGRRHVELWSLANDFAKSGLDLETAYNIILKINDSWGKDAKDESEVYRAVKDGYKYAG